MSGLNRSAGLQFEKHRAFARILLSNGERRDGCVFVAGVSARHEGPERVGELLEKQDGFLPLESNGADARTFLINPSHILMVELAEDEARSDSGYAVARRQAVSLLLSSGQRITGVVHVHRPEGHDRLSDWTRQPGRFRYVETTSGTCLLNASHIVEVSEIPE
jgi:hypothetical protein